MAHQTSSAAKPAVRDLCGNRYEQKTSWDTDEFLAVAVLVIAMIAFFYAWLRRRRRRQKEPEVKAETRFRRIYEARMVGKQRTQHAKGRLQRKQNAGKDSGGDRICTFKFELNAERWITIPAKATPQPQPQQQAKPMHEIGRQHRSRNRSRRRSRCKELDKRRRIGRQRRSRNRSSCKRSRRKSFWLNYYRTQR